MVIPELAISLLTQKVPCFAIADGERLLYSGIPYASESSLV